MDYETIYNKFFAKIDDPKLLAYDDESLYEILNDYLTSTLSIPYVRKLFKSIKKNDYKEILTYELNVSIDEFSDVNFVIEVLAMGMVIQWMTQKVDTALSFATLLGGKEEKMLRNEYKANKERLRELNKELKKIIRDSNYIDNSYIKGDL